VVVRAAVAVAHAGRRVRAHPAAAAGMIQVVAFARRDNPSIARFRERLEDAADEGVVCCLARRGRFVEAMHDLRHRIANPVLFRRIQRQAAVRGRMHVHVRAQPHRAALRPGTPVGHQLVAEQQPSGSIAQTRVASRRALPHARIVAHERPIRPAAEVLAGDQAVGHVLPRIRLLVDRRRCRDEAVPVHVAPDQPGAVREAVREPRVRRQQQQVRAPAVPRRDDERLGSVLDGVGRSILMHTRGGDDGGPAIVEDQPSDQRAIVQDDLLRLDQLSEREVGRVPGAGGTHLAAGVVHAAGTAAAERRQVARHGQRIEPETAVLCPGFQQLQVVRQRNRALRVRLRPAVPRIRARLAADVQTPFRFTVVALEIRPRDRPVDREPVH